MNLENYFYLRGGLLILGLLLTSLGLWYRAKRTINRTYQTRGVVIHLRKVSFEGWDTFSPVVRFTTHDGRALSFTDPVAKFPPEYEVGEHTHVLYDPKDPHQARAVKNVSDLFMAAQMFGLTGTGLLLAALIVAAATWISRQLSGVL
jgi:hypothetical protein